jgi:hypothetical protein
MVRRAVDPLCLRARLGRFRRFALALHLVDPVSDLPLARSTDQPLNKLRLVTVVLEPGDADRRCGAPRSPASRGRGLKRGREELNRLTKDVALRHRRRAK